MQHIDNTLWGPALWMLLHSSAERFGTKALHRLPQEESRIWSHLLLSLRFSLPCPHCKKHYQTYLSQYPFSARSRDEVRIWLYRLHDTVNQRLQKAHTLSLTEVEEKYSEPFCFSKHRGDFIEQVRVAVQQGWCSHIDMGNTYRALEEMKRFYDFF